MVKDMDERNISGIIRSFFIIFTSIFLALQNGPYKLFIKKKRKTITQGCFIFCNKRLEILRDLMCTVLSTAL